MFSFLGWNDEGSWIVGQFDAKVYVWNIKNKTATLRYDRDIDIPQEVIATLKNFNGLTHYWSDPNLPMESVTAWMTYNPEHHDGAYFNAIKINWINDTAVPMVSFNGNARDLRSGVSGERYLGWNDQGSWFEHGADGSIIVWNLKENSLTRVAKELKDVPMETLTSFRNSQMAPILARMNPGSVPPEPKRGPIVTPQVPDTTARQKILGDPGSLPQGAPPAFSGSGAAVQDGVLTFTRADKSKASYKVVRPKVAQGNPAAGSTGAWITMEEGGKGIMFSVGTDGSVTGREMPAQVIQMLIQPVAQR